jgi:hypothetical protein
MSEVNKLDMAEEPITVKKNRSVKKYSVIEEQIIMDLVMLYPDNMAHAFSEASKKLKNRAKHSIAQKYYSMINKGSKKSPVVTGSAAGFSANKSTKRVKGQFIRKEPLQPLIVIFKQLLECDPVQRKKIMEFLKTIE